MLWSWVMGVTAGAAGMVGWAAAAMGLASGAALLRPSPHRLAALGVALAVGLGCLWGQVRSAPPDPWPAPATVTATLSVEQGGGGGVIAHASIDGQPWLLRLTRTPDDWVIGTQAQATLRLFPPHSSRNFGVSSFEDYLTREGIGATGYVKAVDWSAAPTSFRGGLQRWIWAQNPHHPAILTALGLGERGGLGRSERQLWQQSGVAHLLAISGLHVGLVIGGVFWVVGRGLPRLAPWWCQRHRIEAWAAGAGLLAGIAFGALAGWSVPTIRAVVMAAFLMAGWLFDRRHSPGLALAWAAAWLALADPADLLGPGFWLSFSAVGALLAALPLMTSALQRLPQFIRPAAAMVLATGVASLATAPWGIWFFGQIPSLSLPANAVAIPLTTFVLVPGVLAVAVLWALGLTTPAAAILAGLDYVIDLLERGLAWGLAWLPPWYPAIPAVLGASLLGLIGVGLALRGRSGAWRGGGLGVALAALAMALPNLPPQPADAPLLVALDVGQAQAVVIRGGDGHAWLIDAGGRSSPRFDPGFDAIAPALRALGVTRLDALVVSHRQQDHGGAAAGVLSAMPVGQIWAPPSLGEDPPGFWRALQRQAQRQGVEIVTLHRGMDRRAGVLAVQVLWPPAEGGGSGNGNSLVLAVDFPLGRWLLPGDLERRQEGQIDWPRAEGMLMPHHGSRTSSTPAMVAAVAPRRVLVSAGYLNRYGFPAPEVVARYLALGGRVWNTADGGAIAVSQGGVRQARDTAPEALTLWRWAVPWARSESSP